MPANQKVKNGLLLMITVIGIASVFFLDPIPQDIKYHLFADKRCLSFLPNFWNVISNLPFVFVGAAGMFLIIKKGREGNSPPMPANCFVFFLGIFLTGFGSGYYHFGPTNETLLWDRLPMTISFMSFFSIVIGEFICEKSGERFLLPMVTIGLLSLIYWQMTDSRGAGDLRFYALVQFLPVILIPIILFIYKNNKQLKIYFWFILATYVIAKLFEASDHLIFNLAHVISGHSIKHFVAATGPAIFLFTVWKRRIKTIRS